MASPCTCTRKHTRGYGSSRSLVRRIGSKLPIRTGKRLYIRIPGADSPSVHTTENEFRYEATGQRFVPNEEGLTLASYINNPRQFLSKATGLFDFNPTEEEWTGGEEIMHMEGEEEEEEEEEEEQDGDEMKSEIGDKKKEAMSKISVLESELAKLKAQIAVYAMSEVDMETDGSSEPPVPPPPPPVPPPPPALQSQQNNSTDFPVSSTTHSSSSSSSLRPREPPATPATGSHQQGMSNILRDIGSVKLRTVNTARSPGGTPLRPTKGRAAAAADPNDPASIIAQALRKKFSHKVFKDSPDKENLDRSDASINLGFESPTVKLLKK